MDFFKDQVIDLTKKAKSRKKSQNSSNKKTPVYNPNEPCCILGKNKKYKVKSGWGNVNCDVLFLVEQYNEYAFTLIKYLEDTLNIKNMFYLYPALECTVNDNYSLNDAIAPFITCNKQHVNNVIKRFRPKHIITFGRSLYSITKDKSVNANAIGYNRIFSQEYNCYVYPCHPIEWLIQKRNNTTFIEDNWRVYLLRKHVNNIYNKEIHIPEKYEYKNILIEDSEQCYSILNSLVKSNSKCFVYDIETTGLNYLEDRIVSIQLCIDKNNSYFFPWELIDDKAKIYLNTLFTNKISIAHNGKFDMKFLKIQNIKANVKFDTMLAHHILNPDLKHGLKIICWKYTQFGGYDNQLDNYKSEKKIKGDYGKIDKNILMKYGCMDVRVTYLLYKKFKEEFTKKNNEKLKWVFENISTPLSEVFCDAEMKGILIDTTYLEQYKNKIENEFNENINKIYVSLGTQDVNINSNKQLLPYIKRLKLPQIKETKKGGFSLDNTTFKEWADRGFELGKLLLKYSELRKLMTTYIGSPTSKKGVWKHIQKDNRLHPTFNIHGTASGRTSSSNPNFQNQPKDRSFRQIYTTPKDYVFIEADFSQAELRIATVYSQDEGMLQAYREGKDIHSDTACRLNNMNYDEFQKRRKEGDDKIDKIRKKAKTVNFGIIYGESKYSLGPQLGISIEEAEVFLNDYFKARPGLAIWRDKTQKFTFNTTYTETLFGRKRWFPELEYKKNIPGKKLGEYSRQSMNTPIQGSASDYALLSLISVYKYLKSNNFKSNILGMVHDSIVIEAHTNELNIIIPSIKNIMESQVDIGVKMVADVEVSKIWGFKDE